jgi:hypothetical protein
MFAGAYGGVFVTARWQCNSRISRQSHKEIVRQVTLELIFIGLAITLEPIPLTAFILVVSSKNGVRKGAGFIFGWLLSLAIIIALTVLVTGNKPPKPNTAPSLAALAVKIAIGVGLLLIALRQRRRMGRPKKPKKPPKWQSGIDNMSPWFAIGLAPLVQPWGLVAAGVADITGAKLSSVGSYVALVLFCLVSTAAYLVMEVYAGFWPVQAQAFIARLRAWIDAHTDQVIIIVSVALGLWLIGKSIYLIVT